jgi:hypothetical protein
MSMPPFPRRQPIGSEKRRCRDSNAVSWLFYTPKVATFFFVSHTFFSGEDLMLYVRRVTLIASFPLLTTACVDDMVTPPITDASQLLVGTPTSMLFDVPAIQIELPPQPHSWQLSDSALVAAVRDEDGVVIVAFKERTSPRVGDLRAPQVIRGTTRFFGTRAAVSAQTMQEGLDLLDGLGAQKIYDYPHIAGAAVRIDPELAPELAVGSDAPA